MKLKNMGKTKYYCYICGTEITSKNETDEHIILNALGGHLHSKTIICDTCNKKIGEKADAKLAEDLSFYTDMLKVKKDRQNKHNQVMIDSDGHEIIVEDGGQSLYLRKPYIVVDSNEGVKNVHFTVRNMDELDSILKGLVKRKELTQEEADKILKEAKVSEYNPTLKTETCISEEAFPSIIKSAANFYVEKTQDVKTVKHLVPYIEGNADCKDVLYLHHFKNLPYPEVQRQVTHMIHVEGSANTGLLYAMMEYYSIFVYIVVLENNYKGKDVNLTYTYDVVSGQEVNRSFSLPMTLNELDTFRNQPYEQYITYLSYIKKRADAVMSVWEQDKDKLELGDVVEKAFSKYPEGCTLTPEILDEVQKEIMDYFEKKIVRSFKIKN